MAKPDAGRRVLVQDFVDVARPLEAVSDRLRGDASWLAPLAEAAEEDGETVRLRIGPAWAGGRLTREVRARLGALRQRGSALVQPILWEASGFRPLFPVLDGDLELAPLGESECRLTLFASYVPPFGEIGRGLDRALMHWVAQSTVRSFLRRLALELELGGPAPSTSPARGEQRPPP